MPAMNARCPLGSIQLGPYGVCQSRSNNDQIQYMLVRFLCTENIYRNVVNIDEKKIAFLYNVHVYIHIRQIIIITINENGNIVLNGLIHIIDYRNLWFIDEKIRFYCFVRLSLNDFSTGTFSKWNDSLHFQPFSNEYSEQKRMPIPL